MVDEGSDRLPEAAACFLLAQTDHNLFTLMTQDYFCLLAVWRASGGSGGSTGDLNCNITQKARASKRREATQRRLVTSQRRPDTQRQIVNTAFDESAIGTVS